MKANTNFILRLVGSYVLLVPVGTLDCGMCRQLHQIKGNITSSFCSRGVRPCNVQFSKRLTAEMAKQIYNVTSTLYHNVQWLLQQKQAPKLQLRIHTLQKKKRKKKKERKKDMTAYSNGSCFLLWVLLGFRFQVPYNKYSFYNLQFLTSSNKYSSKKTFSIKTNVEKAKDMHKDTTYCYIHFPT